LGGRPLKGKMKTNLDLGWRAAVTSMCPR
jgi:hypothetical protein